MNARGIFAVLALAGVALTVPSTAPAVVQCSVPGQPIVNVPGTYSSIQSAIDGAAEGSCIVVAPGTYTVNLHVIGRYVELKASSSDPTQTILDGGHLNSVVVFQNVPYNAAVPNLPVARISGFTIQNGKSVEGQGGGVTLANRAEVIVANNIIKNNASAMDGGGILVYNRSHATIVNNTITGNSAPRFGAGIFVVGDGSASGGSNPVISNNTISGNALTGANIPGGGSAGGGIFVDFNSAPFIIGNSLTGNSAPFAGGAICLRAGAGGFIESNTITGNSAPFGGGIHIETVGSAVVVANNTISNNNAQPNASFPSIGFGGGVSVFAQSQPTISGNTISGNTAAYGGGGLVVTEGANALIRSNIISGNIVNGNPASSPIGPPPGGGLYISQATVSAVNNVVSGNSAAIGGGIGLLGGPSGPTNVTIENNTIVKNVATVTPASATGRGGGGLFVPNHSSGAPDTNTVVRNNIFDLNTGFQIFESFPGGATYVNNLVNEFSDGMYFNYTSGDLHTIGNFNGTVTGSGNISGPTAFVNAGANDFRLTGSSAAIDHGTPTGAPPDDIANMNRPAGAGYDIGAYEFTSQPVAKSPVYRFYSVVNTVHFYTQSRVERDQILVTYPYQYWRYEGISYQTYPSQAPGTVPLHRFYSFTYQVHFYTTNLCEMFTDCQVHPPGDPHNIYADNVWHYEAIAFYVYLSQVAGSTAVHRFYSFTYQAHFYTTNLCEMFTDCQAHPPGDPHNIYPDNVWHYEGVAFYV